MPNKQAIVETAKGTVELELFADEVPNTVANFEKLANAGFYDGTRFHRVIPNFMIQGGDPYSKTGKGRVGTGGPGFTHKRGKGKKGPPPPPGARPLGAARTGTGGGASCVASSRAGRPRRRTRARRRCG